MSRGRSDHGTFRLVSCFLWIFFDGCVWDCDVERPPLRLCTYSGLFVGLVVMDNRRTGY